MKNNKELENDNYTIIDELPLNLKDKNNFEQEELVALNIYNFYELKNTNKELFLNSLFCFNLFDEYKNDWKKFTTEQILDKYFPIVSTFFNNNPDDFYDFEKSTDNLKVNLKMTKNDMLCFIDKLINFQNIDERDQYE